MSRRPLSAALSIPAGDRRFTTPAGLSPGRVGLVSRTDAGSATFVPLSPIALPTTVIDQSLVIATVTMLKRTPIHPHQFVRAVHSRQRPPQAH
jgi:hypothetical protein